MVELPDKDNITQTFAEMCKTLAIDNHENSSRLVVYDMTDGMRTSTSLEGADAYFDGAMFALKLMHILKVEGSKTMYTNVAEEKHVARQNFPSILDALKRCPPIYEKYAQENDVRLVFLGDYHILDPSGNFGRVLDNLTEKTENNKSFTSIYLLGYSLDWAIKHEDIIRSFPEINVTIRHTKMQLPTDMQLPYGKSDRSNLVYVQQGSSDINWSEKQLIGLSGIALRSMLVNEGTHYWKTYDLGEREAIKQEREIGLLQLSNDLYSDAPPIYPKRVIMTSPLGPEVYLI